MPKKIALVCEAAKLALDASTALFSVNMDLLVWKPPNFSFCTKGKIVPVNSNKKLKIHKTVGGKTG